MAATIAPDWEWLGGQGRVINNKFNAPDGPICSDLREAGALLAASADFQHSYPHSWRSKAKVIYRCTPQWFIPMDRSEREPRRLRRRPHPPSPGEGDLRDRARAIDDTRWVPGKIEEPHPRDGRGAARLGDQPPARLGRADRALRQPQDRRLSQGRRRSTAASSAPSTKAAPTPGSQADHQALLGNGYQLDDYEPVNRHPRRLVRFSGSTHAYVIEARYGEGVRADLYRRRLGPASRLVPVLAARKQRHARPRALSTRC